MDKLVIGEKPANNPKATPDKGDWEGLPPPAGSGGGAPGSFSFFPSSTSRPGWRSSPLRIFLAIGVLALAAGLYSAHFADVMDELNASRAISDAAGILSKEDLALAADFAKILHERVGLELRLATYVGEPPPQKLNAGTLFIGLGSDRAVVVLPPLALPALGPEVSGYLQNEHFRPYLAEGRAGEGLRSAFNILWKGLIGTGETSGSR